MAKKGRPFTYQSDEERPVTISLRVPKELHTRLDRYAKQHRQYISELLIDGMEWRIGDGDPRGLGDGTGTKSHRGITVIQRMMCWHRSARIMSGSFKKLSMGLPSRNHN